MKRNWFSLLMLFSLEHLQAQFFFKIVKSQKSCVQWLSIVNISIQGLLRFRPLTYIFFSNN